MNVSTTELIENERLLAISLWRGGQYAEAREVIKLALSRGVNTEQKIALSINLAQVERGAGNAETALKILKGVAAEIESYFSPLIKGKYFNQLGSVYFTLGRIDDAFEAFTAASVWYERAKEWRLRADVENNIAVLMIETRRFDEAHEHLDDALTGCNDEIVHAQIRETRARAYLLSGHLREALECALSSAVALIGTEEKRLLFETLETLGNVYRELRRDDERHEIARALEVTAGNVSVAASMLGLSRQALYWKLEHQYQDLLPLREPKKKPRGRYAYK